MRTQMFRLLKLALAATICLLLAGAVPRAQNRSELALKAAIDKEVVDGDLKGAIAAYQRVVANAGANRALAVEALMHMAECYRKMGDAESRNIYERIVRDYGDQRDAAATARVRLNDEAASPSITTRRVWAGQNVDTYGGVSPDGRFLSFTDWETGDLAVHDLTTGRNRRLTNKKDWNDPAFAEGSAISPDGRQIAYGWLLISPTVQTARHFAEVRVIDASGGTPRVLFTGRGQGVESVYVHEWSRDGRWLAVLLERTDRNFQIGLVSATDGALRVLASLGRDPTTRLALSPDGRYLAYDRAPNAESEQREIHLMSVDGSRDAPALPHPARDHVLAWSADGKHLLFSSDRSGVRGIWALPVSDGKTAGEPDLISANINPSSLGLTRSGALYYGVAASTPDIYVAAVDFETGKVLSQPTIIPKPYFGLIDFPQWSPDGKYLAYLSLRDPNSRNGRLSALSIRSIETGNVRELRPDLPYLNARGTRPLWAPDNTFLLVNATDPNEQQGIYKIDARTGEAAPFIVGQPGREIVTARALSRDGRTLFLSRRDLASETEVLLARAMGSGDERELARRQGGWGRGTDVSPDGKTIAIMGPDRSTGATTLFLIPVDGGSARELLRASRPEMIIGSLVKWSPDGQSLLVAKDKGDGARRELWRVAAGDGLARKVDLNAEWVHFLGVPGHDATSFHPDGRQVAFVKGESQLEIWALENFLPVLGTKK